MNIRKILQSTRLSLLVTLLIVVLPLILRGQNAASFKEPTVMTPNAASIQKFIDIPVSYHTGVPNLSIPIHTISDGSISIPISLSYNSSGVKVDEVASWVGLSWTLNAQGMISRTVQGRHDETGILSNTATYNTLNTQPCYSDPNCDYDPNVGNCSCRIAAYEVTEGIKDVESDIYSFSFGGHSGKFVFDLNGNIQMLQSSDVKIIHNLSNFNQWTAIAPDGTKYYFGNIFGQTAKEESFGVNRIFSTTWYLVRVESQDKKHQINFKYASGTSTQYSRNDHGITISNGSLSETNPDNFSSTFENNISITEITTSTGLEKVTFVPSSSIRLDVSSTNSYALAEIKIETGSYCKKFVFNTDYFEGKPIPAVSPSANDIKRLRLISIQEMTCDGSSNVNPYVFTYNGQQLPRRMSMAKDQFGYYNGNDINTGLLPHQIQTNSDFGFQVITPTYKGNRTPNETFMKAGVLEKVQYPSGGYTELDYEAHRKNPTDTKIYGGLRVKQMRIKENETASPIVKNFAYSNGLLFGDDSLVYRINLKERCSDCFPSPTLGSGLGGCWAAVPTTYTSINPKSYQGYHFGYQNVSVSQVNNGTNEYSYAFDDFYALGSNSFSRYPYGPAIGVQDNVTNTLEVVKNSQSQIVSKKEYDYNNFIVAAVPGKKIATVTSGTGISSCAGVVRYLVIDYNIRIVRKSLKTQKETIDNIITQTDFVYDNLFRFTSPIEVKKTNSDGKEYTSKYYYAHNLPNNHLNFGGDYSIQAALLANNMIATALQVEQYIGTSKVGGSVVTFKNLSTASLSLGATAYAQAAELYIDKLFAINKDGTSRLETTVDEYEFGMPKRVTKAGFSTSAIYTWDTYKRITSKTFGSLRWSYEYWGNSGFVKAITDENGLRKKFQYDGLLRLKTVQDRFSGSVDAPTDVQATTDYIYQYKNATHPYSFVGTTTTFKDGAAPLSTKQYMDGLGRPVQTIKENYGASGKFVKSTITYDVLGREDKTFHPFESVTNGVEAPPAYVTPYRYAQYEQSPLSRPIKQFNEDGTFVLMSYSTNTGTEVARFSVTTQSNINNDDVVAPNGFYTANQLSKITLTNENGKQTQVFKDKLGRVVLTRKILNGQNVDTYNVYDDYGNLVMVIPPDAMNASNQPILHLVFCYKFDNQNRLHRKKVPGADWQKFYYDNRDLLTLTQDGNTRSTASGGNANRYIGTQYDNLGRVLKTGWVTTTTPEGFATSNFIIPDDANKLTEIQYYQRNATTGQISPTGTLGSSWVKHQGAKVLKPVGVITPSEFVWSYVERRPGMEYTGNPVWSGKQHFMNGTLPNGPISDADSYGVDWSITGYNGLQKPTTTLRYLYANSSTGGQVRTIDNFFYDNAQRLTDIKHMYALNGAGLVTPTLTLSNMVYNHKDQLVEKNIGKMTTHNRFLQSIDYDYNTRGWLTAINAFNLGNPPAQAQQQILTPQSTLNGTVVNMASIPFMTEALMTTSPPVIADENVDLFSQNINYNTVDSRFGVTPQYNGNISATSWFVAGRAIQSYGYVYDDLDRLTEAKYYDITQSGGGITATTSTFSTDKKYDEKLTYDKRGNILSLHRNGLNGGNWTSQGYTSATFGLIDNLVYGYGDSNRLMKVVDASLLGKGFKSQNNINARQYSYDENGNLTADVNKQIIKIEYNFLNLPQLIRLTNNRSITFIYDATGVKLRKIVDNAGTKTTYDYVNGIEYKNNILERIAHSEGQVTRNSSGAYEYEYVLKDHLGNTRVTFKDANNDGIVASSDICQINNFYPFGLNMEGNWNGAAGSNKYQYNGKEWNDDFGLGWNDYGARFYDPAVGRWMSADPLAELRLPVSAYQYVQNNPINAIDPTGMLDQSFYGRDIKAMGEDIAERAKGGEFNRNHKAKKEQANNNEDQDGDAPEWVKELMSPESTFEGSTAALVVTTSLPLAAIDGPVPIADGVVAVAAAVALVYDATVRTYITYEIYNPALNQYYVGRASGFGTSQQVFNRRFNSHKFKDFISKNRGYYSIDQTIQSYPAGYWAIRGREQQLYDYHKNLGHNLANLSRPIFYYHPFAYFYHQMSNAAFGEIAPYTGYQIKRP